MATDFPNGVSSPAAPSYASPLLDFGIVGDLPKTIFEGQQRARTTQGQTMFRNGIPKTPEGGNDYSAMTDKLIQFGDLEGAGKVANLGFAQQALSGTSNNTESPDYRGPRPGAAAPAQPVPAARNSSTTTAATSRDETPARPDNNGGFTAPGADAQTQPSMPYAEPPRIRTALNQYDNPQNPDVEARKRNLGQLMKNPYYKDYAKLRLEYLLKADEPTPTMKDVSSGALGESERIKREQKDLERTPEEKNLGMRGGPGGGATAAAGGAPGTQPVSATQAASNIKQRADLDTKSGEGDITSWQKQNEGFQKLAMNSYDAVHKADLAKSLTMQPGFYSGPLSKTSEAYNQFRAAFGADPTSAVPQEAYQKVVSDMTQGAIRDLAAAGVGRIMLAEVQTIQKSMGSLGISPAGNRAQLELFKRVSMQSQDIAKIAQGISANQNIPPEQKKTALDKAVMQFHQTHPLVSQQEIDNPTILSAPDVPQGIASNVQLGAWARRVGIPPGGAIKIDGRVTGAP